MKKIISVLLVTVLMMTFLVGCGESRKLFGNVDLDKYVSLNKADYIGVNVDTGSEEFITKYYDYEYDYDVAEKSLYKNITDGAVENGDIINLDYAGKIDGVAFDGGTAEDQSLEIGSGTFIDDFEEELIGAVIGETRDITAKFPENYGNEDLNGKEAVFTCTINSISRPMTVEESYSKMGYLSADEYKDALTKRAVKSYILNYICSKATIKEFPEADSDKMIDAIFEESVDEFKAIYNMDFEEFLSQSGYTIEQYKAALESEEVFDTMMRTSMPVYYVLDEEGLEIDDITLEKQTVEQEYLVELYAVQDIVLEYLYGKAVIK